MTCCFQILGISPGSSTKEIEKAFRKKARETHPDKFLDPVEKQRATADFRNVYGAYEAALSGDDTWSRWQASSAPTDDSNSEAQKEERSNEKDYRASSSTPTDGSTSEAQKEERSSEKAYRAYRDVSEELDGRVAAIREQLASKHSFHLREMNSDLGQALRYAHEGNNRIMEVCIDDATQHAKKCNGKNADFSRRVAAIRRNQASEHSFHLREMNSDLGQALRYAHEGNNRIMEVCIDDATQHAKKCNGKNADFSHRVAAIRRNQASEHSFHLREMNSDLGQALRYAHEGNNRIMEVCIDDAMQHAKKCNGKNADFSHRVAAIRGNQASEHSFHLREMNSDLGQASRYAHEGNNRMMEVCIDDATQHAKKCNGKNADFSRRVAAIRGNQASENSDPKPRLFVLAMIVGLVSWLFPSIAKN